MNEYRQPRRQAHRQSIDGIRTGRRRFDRYGAARNDAAGRPTPVDRLAAPGPAESAERPPAIDMSLPPAAKEQPVNRQLTARNSWRNSWKKKTVFACSTLLLVLVGFVAVDVYLKLHNTFHGGTSAAALKEDVDPNLLKGEGDGRVNILLMGRGGDGHEAPDLTDTMIIASVDPVNKTAALVSVPRDLWISIPNKGSMKLNAAYETGKYTYLGEENADSTNRQAIDAGFSQADQTVENVLGIPIHYNMLIDFRAFSQAVNTVGGITVDVPEQLWDPTMAWENNWNPVLAQPGVQKMGGTKALLYVRSRETSSDFARSQRQRAVILALKNKIDTLGTLSNPVKLSGLMNAFGDNVQTDLSLTDSGRLYSILQSITSDHITSIGLSDGKNNFVTTGNIGGQSVVLPVAGEFDYTAIQNYIRRSLPDGYIIKEHASVAIYNGSAQPGLATKAAELLKSYGYNVTTVANAPTRTYTKNVVVDNTHGSKKYTLHYLERRFGVQATSQLPDASMPAANADFVIILGK